MAKYEKHPDIEGKFRCPICTYGHKKGLTRQAVSKHFNNKHKAEENNKQEPPEVKEVEPEVEVVEPLKEIEIPGPDWLNVEWGEEEGGIIGSIPLPAKGLLRSLSSNAQPVAQTPEALREWYAQQAKLLRYFLAGVADPLVSWYGRGVTLNPDFKIARSKDEWDLLESVGTQWFAHHEIAFPVNPDLLMVATIGALYVPPVMQIRRERDPSRPSWGPFVTFRRWRERRAIQKALKSNPLNEGSDGFGSVE